MQIDKFWLITSIWYILLSVAPNTSSIKWEYVIVKWSSLRIGLTDVDYFCPWF